MTREDIIHMAREAGAERNSDFPDWSFEDETLERFAALIASQVAEHIRETEFKPDWNNYRQGFADGVAEEREACAKVVEDTKEWKGVDGSARCASTPRGPLPPPSAQEGRYEQVKRFLK